MSSRRDTEHDCTAGAKGRLCGNDVIASVGAALPALLPERPVADGRRFGGGPWACYGPAPMRRRRIAAGLIVCAVALAVGRWRAGTRQRIALPAALPVDSEVAT